MSRPAAPPGAEASLPPDRPFGRRRTLLRCAALFALSFLLRFLAYSGMEAERAKPLYDERGYYDQAVGFSQVLTAWAHGETPTRASWNLAYRGGVWPPGYPALLGGVFAAFGAGARTARWAVMLLSALTTVLVYRVTRRMAAGGQGDPSAVAEKAGLAAGFAHLLYPGFLFFGHLLWSETAFLFCTFVALGAALGVRRAERPGVRLGAAALLGLAVGAGVLVRVTALPWLLLAPLWPLLVLRRKSGEPGEPGRWGGWPSAGAGLAAATILLASLAVVAPWQRTLVRNEGRFVLLSTAGGYNLLLGAGGDAGKGEVRRAIAERARGAGIHSDLAAREIAIETIRSAPGAFLARVAERASGIWRGDEIVYRHLLRAVYPPRPPGAALTLLALILVAEAALLLAALLGLFRWPKGAAPERLLLLAAIASILAPPLLTVGNTRMALPALALALPFAGVGLAALRARPLRPVLAAAGLPFLALFALNLRLGGASSASFEPSSYYAGILPAVDGWFGTRTPVADCVELRAAGSEPPAEVRIALGPGYGLGEARKSHALWRPAERRQLSLRPWGLRPAGPLEIEIASGPGRRSLLRPIQPGFWMTWQPSGLSGVEVRWCGGAGAGAGAGGGNRKRPAKGPAHPA